MTGEQLLQALAAQPGGPQLLELGQTGEELALVGGAVRDLLLGRAPRELDVVLAGDLPALAATLAALLGASVTAHERFGTAIVAWQQGRIDLAARRAESYSAPGALPDVRPGSLEQDLRRRDFTVNAIALPLGGPHRGQLQAAEHALEDLRERRLRVLHDHSFRDDPTRLLRLARYRARLRFGVEPHTAELAAQALAAGALASVSPARIGAELRLALQEADAVAALQALGELGVLAALASSRQGQPLLRFDAQLARQALALLPDDGRPELLLMATLLLDLAADTSSDPQPVMFELLDSLEFSAGERQRIIRSALGASALSRELERAHKPSQLHQALSAQTLEAVALTGGLIAARQRHVPAQLSDWLARLRHVQLQINGEDLLAAGIRSGPELGMRLNAALARKLDGELAEGREAELQAALEAEVQRR